MKNIPQEVKKRFNVWCFDKKRYNINDSVVMADFVLPIDVSKAQATKICKILNDAWEKS